MLDKERLREALVGVDAFGWKPNVRNVALEVVVEAARLVASETTLIVEKVNGEVGEDVRGHPLWLSGYESGTYDGKLVGYDDGFRAGLVAGMVSQTEGTGPDALVVQKVDEEWPDEIVTLLAELVYTARWEVTDESRTLSQLLKDQAATVLDALLAQQTGDTE